MQIPKYFYFRVKTDRKGLTVEIEDASDVDVVEVVRCAECKHTKTDGMDDPAIYCKKWDRWEMPSDFYCKYGERRGGADDAVDN